MDNIEIQCILHENCNLNCNFCFETDNGIREKSNIDIDFISNILPEAVSKLIKEVYEKNHIQEINISIMGGELFQDNFSDEIFLNYYQFTNNLKNKVELISKDIELFFTVTSNGIFNNHKRVKKFLLENNYDLVLSYDINGRFKNENQRKIWLDTYKYFNKYNIPFIISFILTKSNINSFINGDKIFNEIIKNNFIDCSIYQPRLDYKDDIPSDDDLFNFYKYCIDNKFYSVSHIDDLINSIDGNYESDCKYRGNYIFNKEFIKKYGNIYIQKCTEESPIPKEIYYGENSDKIIDINNCPKYKQKLGLVKRGCLYCKYYKYYKFCPKMCWTQILFSDYKITECPYKRILNFLIDK